MSEVSDRVTEADLEAYVDEQLDAAHRIRVEAHLAARPEAAARVMADLRTRDELRLALAFDADAGRPATDEAARRLQRGLARGRSLHRLRRAAAVALLLGAGWGAHEVAGPMSVAEVNASALPPAYVEDAVRAHETTLLRASMASQPEAPRYDPEELRAATAIAMPALPDDWRVRDVQVYPSRFGPSIELVAEAAGLGPVSLFAIRPGGFDVARPTLVAGGSTTSTHFRIGEVAYVLVAGGDSATLQRVAGSLAASLY